MCCAERYGQLFRCFRLWGGFMLSLRCRERILCGWSPIGNILHCWRLTNSCNFVRIPSCGLWSICGRVCGRIPRNGSAFRQRFCVWKTGFSRCAVPKGVLSTGSMLSNKSGYWLSWSRLIRWAIRRRRRITGRESLPKDQKSVIWFITAISVRTCRNRIMPR